eukprot:685146-Amorphochlora_amoeboformis.AAC.1
MPDSDGVRSVDMGDGRGDGGGVAGLFLAKLQGLALLLARQKVVSQPVVHLDVGCPQLKSIIQLNSTRPNDMG